MFEIEDSLLSLSGEDVTVNDSEVTVVSEDGVTVTSNDVNSIELPASLSLAIDESVLKTSSAIETTVSSLAAAEKLVPADALSALKEAQAQNLITSPPFNPFNIIAGTNKSEVLVGTFSSDLILGFGGNDTIIALPGNDIVLAGEGNDTIYGGPDFLFRPPFPIRSQFPIPSFGSNDSLFGEGGNDRFIGGRGKDLINGGSGFDTADYTDLGQAITLKAQGVVDKGSLGQDQLVAVENIIGARGQRNAIDGSGDNGVTSFDINLSQNKLVVNDIPGLGDVKFSVRNFVDATGTNQDDKIVGNNQANKLVGRGGNDYISGLGGNDTLIGTDPLNELPGLEEIDTLNGGGGRDTFVIADRDVTYYQGGGFFGSADFAYLEDFQSGTDKIQLKKGENYIFGRGFIAVGTDFGFPSVKAVDQAVAGFDGDGVLNLGSSLQSSFKADSALSVDGGADSASLSILPSFDLVAVVNNGFSKGDLVFV